MKACCGVCVLAILAISSGCMPKARSTKHFTLPDGDADRGKQVFVGLKCHECHDVEGVALPVVDYKGRVVIHLGGDVATVKTYGDLLSDIVTPSHQLSPKYPKEVASKDGKSLMTNFNDTMTVSQLIDLVSFLQPHYTLVTPGKYDYVKYPPSGGG